MKYIAIVLIAVMFIACSEDKEIVYVDSNGTPIQKHETFEQEVVCNEFGMAYYANEINGSVIYTPVVVSYYTTNNSTTQYDTPFISCERYDEIKESK